MVVCSAAAVGAQQERPDPTTTDEEGFGGGARVSAPRAFDATERRTGRLEDAEARSLGLVPGRPVVRPTRVEEPPTIDGRLDDPAWEEAAKITRFVQQSPLDGAPATEYTEVFVAYDDDHLYLGFYVHYEDPSIMRASRVDRDRAAMDDLITIYLDTFLDQQRAYDFDLNAYGVQGDGIISSGGGGGPGGGGPIPRADRSWDALFESGAQIVADGFTAEMAIPFKSIRYPQRAEGEPHQWGFQIVREIKSKDGENVVWAPMSRDERSFMGQMGLMEGMTDLSTNRNLEIMPTFTAVQFGEINPRLPGGPGFENDSVDPDAGVNVKYGITSDLTADLTVNPDFSQIESDRPQIEVNRRFPLFFQELRPFFIEGAEIFDVFAPVTFVHTRTIVAPEYGAKLSGQLGRVSLGVLGANDAAPGRVDDPADPRFGQTARTYIGRTKVDLYSESHIGAIVTDRQFMDGYSRAAGGDAQFRLGSTRTANLAAIATRHRDLEGVERRGHMVGTFWRQNSRNLNWTFLAFQTTPDFRTDVGFVRRTDERRVQANVNYRFWPERSLINWGPRVNYGRNWDFDGVLQDENLEFGLNFDFVSNIRVGGSYSRDMERFGGIEFDKSGWSVNANVSRSQALSFGAGFSMGDQIRFTADPFLGDQVNWNVNATLRPVSRLTSSLRVNSSRFTDPRNDDEEVFDIKIFRAQTTFQFTDRLAMRNITEFNTFDNTFDANVLFTYRVNAGTVFFIGYDDHFRQADRIRGDMDGDGVSEQLFIDDRDLRRTSRAFFVKLQYLFRL